jgi:hypothetical protein
MNDPPVYTFDWQLREHAQVIGLLVRERFGSGVWRVVRWLVVIVLALATVVTVASALLGDFGSALRLGPLVILVGGMTFWFEKWTGLIRAWQVRRMDPAVRHPISHALEESGLRVIAKTAETRLSWDGLHKVRETPGFFMFYYGKRIAYYLPKRVVSGLDEVDALRAQILERLPPNVPFEKG